MLQEDDESRESVTSDDSVIEITSNNFVSNYFVRTAGETKVLKKCNEKTKDNSVSTVNDAEFEAPINSVIVDIFGKYKSGLNTVDGQLNECSGKNCVGEEGNSCNVAIKNINYGGNEQIENEESSCEQFDSVSEQSLTLCSAMKYLTEKNHDQAHSRLYMMFPSDCSLQPYMCYKHHQPPKKSSLSECMCEYHFLNGEWDEAVEILEPLVSRTTCPDWKLIVYLLAYMCESSDVENLNTCCEIFSSLVSCHTPCYRQTYYLLIFTQAVTMHSLRNGGISKDGIFRDVLFNLQQYIKVKKVYEGSDLEKSLTHTSNIDSQCLVMELMIDVLETNLSVWLPRRGVNPKSSLSKDPPLVVKLLWGHNKKDCLEGFNDTKIVKPVIDLYVSSFCEDVTSKLVPITSRLLALVAEVMRASDFEEKAWYPHFGRHSKELAHVIYNSIAHQHVSMVQKIIEGLSPSWLEMLVCCVCLSSRFTAVQSLPSLKFVTDSKKATQNSLVRINKKGETRLHVLCRNKRLKELEELLSDPTVDVNVADYAGWTPLHEAAFKGNVENVQTLIVYRPPDAEAGVNLRAPGDAGTTPLMAAAWKNHFSVCELLLKCDASLVEDKDETGKTARHFTNCGHIIELLESYSGLSGSDVGCRAQPSHSIMWKCAPTQEFWDLLSVFSYSYLNTFMLKDYLCHTTAGLSMLPENRDGKARLKFDTDRLNSDMLVLEEVLQYLMSRKVKSIST